MKLEIDLARTIQENAGKIRIGLAALAGLGGLGGAGIPDLLKAMEDSSRSAISRTFEPSKAYADDLLKPPIFQGRDGRNVTIASFEKPGQAYIFTSESGLEVFNAENGLDAPGGVVYGGKVKLIVVSNSPAMNIGVRALNCGEGPSIDVIGDVGGNGYMERAPNAMDILDKEMKRVSAQERREYSEIGMILTLDKLQRQAPPDLIGGSIDMGVRSEPKGCIPQSRTVLVSPGPVVSQPEQRAVVEACSAGDFQIADLNRKGIVSISGVPASVTGNFDLADHAPFRSVSGLEALKNVLGEPGAFLADPSNIPAADKASWDAKVNAGFAEYIRRSGPNINFFDLQSRSDYGVSLNPATGLYEFNLSLPPHVIVRIDAEEAKVFLASANGDRNIRFNMCQPGAAGDSGHQTLFLRSPYGQGSSLRLESPTIPGTQIQIFGEQVKDPTAFASAEAFLQGVGIRQARPGYSKYFVYALNMNDLTLGSAESPALGASFQVIGKNY